MPTQNKLNETVYRWFCLARQCNVPLSKRILQEETRELAKRMGHSEFKALNGCFKRRHNIKQFSVSGEAADVLEETVEGWH